MMNITKLARFMHEKAIEFEGEPKEDGQRWKPYELLEPKTRRRYTYVAKQILIAIKKG